MYSVNRNIFGRRCTREWYLELSGRILTVLDRVDLKNTSCACSTHRLDSSLYRTWLRRKGIVVGCLTCVSLWWKKKVKMMVLLLVEVMWKIQWISRQVSHIL
jgi:hypothetical protein